MLYAKNINGERILPTKDTEARCFGCGSLMIAKMGVIMSHHWAHLTKVECDEWMENEGEWHLGWKKKCTMFPDIEVEKFIKKENVWHFADVYFKNKSTIIELQYSSISVEDIQKREEFYGKMIWLFDCRDAHNEERLCISEQSYGHNFSWKRPKKTIGYANKPIFFDLGDNRILQVKKKTVKTRMYGWGYIISYDKFVSDNLL